MDSLDPLREAARLSPQNIPLRQALADALLNNGLAGEAETEYRAALQISPGNAGLLFGLARAFFQQGKKSHALVTFEDLCQRGDAPARAFVFHARLLAGLGEVKQAVIEYRKGVERDAQAADPELAARLGIDAGPESDVQDGRVAAAWEPPSDDEPTEVERPKITFADVGGMDDLKEEIRMKIIHPLANAELFKAYGKAIGGGILMYGPPGCGKTHLARATAGEIKAGFISVGISDVLDMWIGNSERNLHQLFEQARRNAPCVLFFDEVDALGASRTDMRTSGGRHLINQFLAEMDGINANNDGLLILGATNAPWHLDSAFRRPGRFDRILFVPPPDAAARAAILRLHLHGKPSDDLDVDAVAKKTADCSGADLKGLVDLAIEAKLREVMKSGVPTPLRTKDLAAAAAQVRPSTREWFSTARNYALYSNQGGVYDEILKYLKL
ncbi:MAG: AAA family ATPase [Verrucomicrobiales bacterium]